MGVVKLLFLLDVDKLECVRKRVNTRIFFVEFMTYEEQRQELRLLSLGFKEDPDHNHFFYVCKGCCAKQGPDLFCMVRRGRDRDKGLRF